nr:preprotein translocase subunit SECA [Tanacetum cinerariifolium]
IEAKEGVRIEDATQTYATVTLQNFFRMYHKLGGMTGTAETEAGELWEIYKLDVVVLNAKQNQREAEIVAAAGYPGTVTIATNMAGRVLRVARRQPDAFVWLGAHCQAHGPHGHGRGRSDSALDDYEQHRAGAEKGGGKQLRHPQAPAGVRRRDERPARG